MKYDENGQPTLESVADFPEYVQGFGSDANLDDLDSAFGAGYELGQREVLEQYGPIEEFLQTASMIFFELEFNLSYRDREANKQAGIARAVIGVPGVRAFLAKFIGHDMEDRLGGGDWAVFGDLTEDQQLGIIQIYEDHFVRIA